MIRVKIPALSSSMTEAKIIWIAGEKTIVRKGDRIAVIETDKADIDIEAPGTGMIKTVLAQQGDIVSVGKTIALLEEGYFLEYATLDVVPSRESLAAAMLETACPPGQKTVQFYFNQNLVEVGFYPKKKKLGIILEGFLKAHPEYRQKNATVKAVAEDSEVSHTFF